MSVTYSVAGADITLLDIGQLAMLHDNSRPVDTWLLDTFFPRRASFARKDVPIAELDLDAPVAPYVSPCVEGRPIKENGTADVKYVKPAYLKPKMTITPCTVLDSALVNRLREAGAISRGTLTDQDLFLIDQVQKYKTLHDSIDNRRILMAAELLTTGKIVIESDDFVKYEVDYGRDASLNFSPSTVWSDVGALIVDDINTMVSLLIAKGNAAPTVALTSTSVFNAMLKNTQFKASFIAPVEQVQIAYTPQLIDGMKAQYRGMIGSVQIWVYDAVIKTGGATTRLIPNDFFALISDMNGVLAHCAIQNLKAFGQPLDYFDDQWYNPDPSALFMMTESSPLVVPSNPNGVVGGVDFI